MSSKDMCHQFLAKHRLLANQYDAEEILNAFLDEMEKGLAGQESSLAMIPSYISLPGRAPKNEMIIVLDAGGTNFRTALVRFDQESTPQIEYFVNNPMPGVAREVSKEEFFNQIADYLQPVLKESKRLGFCFSYPATIDRQKDGTLLYWTKEVNAPEVVGQKILANISPVLKKRGLQCPESMTILNDTVSSLLAGVTATGFSTAYNYIGFILGTGTNTAYIECNVNIKKEKGLAADEDMAINCESANFDKVKRGDIDLAFDTTTSIPGKYIFEKMISGGYLGNLCYKILMTATAEGVISQTASRTLEDLGTFSTPFLGTILMGSLDRESGFTDCPVNDLKTIKTIVSEVVERAAFLTAINVAAPIIKSARGGSSKRKYCISVDGSVYYKLYSFRGRAEKNLTEILRPYDIEYKIVQVEEAPIIGAAVAGLVD